MLLNKDGKMTRVAAVSDHYNYGIRNGYVLSAAAKKTTKCGCVGRAGCGCAQKTTVVAKGNNRRPFLDADGKLESAAVAAVAQCSSTCGCSKSQYCHRSGSCQPKSMCTRSNNLGGCRCPLEL